ncbi:MAG: DnaJ domain-containing protein, partial [Desulfobacterales bacterium]|nr:DnaJ domain-containing protein [Desulfobacterales bacterium]
MTNKRDYYEVLGLSRNASESEIKASYRKLA